MKIAALLFIFLFASISFAAPLQTSNGNDNGGAAPASGTTNVYLNGHMLMKIDDSRTYYFSDYLGSTRIVTDERGQITGKLNYAPFGKQLITGDEEITFTGKEQDSTGLQYFGARYYDPDTGRFTQIDPVYESSAGSYNYGENSPVKYVDLDGNQAVLPMPVPFAPPVYVPPQLANQIMEESRKPIILPNIPPIFKPSFLGIMIMVAAEVGLRNAAKNLGIPITRNAPVSTSIPATVQNPASSSGGIPIERQMPLVMNKGYIIPFSSGMIPFSGGMIDLNQGNFQRQLEGSPTMGGIVNTATRDVFLFGVHNHDQVAKYIMAKTGAKAGDLVGFTYIHDNEDNALAAGASSFEWISLAEQTGQRAHDFQTTMFAANLAINSLASAGVDVSQTDLGIFTSSGYDRIRNGQIIEQDGTTLKNPISLFK